MEHQKAVNLRQRSTREVFEDHLELRRVHNLEQDIQRNYSTDVIMISLMGKFHGHEGVRQTASNLEWYLPKGNYEYFKKVVEGDIAFLVWGGKSENGIVHNGVDTFIIREGKILCQTIHYLVENHEPK